MAVINDYVNSDYKSGKLLDAKSNGGTSLKTFVISFEVAASDDDGSVYRLMSIPSTASIFDLAISNDAITGGTDYDIGLYDTSDNGSAVVDKDLFADGLDLSSAGDKANANTAPDIADIGKKIWEYSALSLTENPSKEYDLAITANTVGTAAGTITVHITLGV